MVLLQKQRKYTVCKCFTVKFYKLLGKIPFFHKKYYLSISNAALVKWSFDSHPSNRVSFSRFELRIKSDFERARASLPVCGRAFFCFSFPNLHLSLASLSRKRSWRRDLIPRPPRKCAEVVHSPPRPQCLGFYPTSKQITPC